MHRPPPSSHIPQPRLTPPAYTPAQQPARIASKSRVNWSSLARELSVTFLGVLLALGANSVWQDRRERARQHDELERLLPAARENENRVIQAVREDSITEARALRITELLESNSATPPLDSMVKWLLDATSVRPLRPVTGAFAALAQTGGLRLVRNVELRGRIASYQRTLDATADVFGRTNPIALENRLHMSRLLVVARDSAQAWQVAGSLRNNPEVRRVLEDARSIAGHRLALLVPLRNESTALRKALEDELQVTPITPDPAKD